jgi:hypothetical protein
MKRAALIALAVGLCLAGGCSPQKPPAVQETPSGGKAGPRAGAPQPSWRLKLDVPETIQSGKPIDMVLRVYDATAQPVDSAVVEASLVMATMDMGENQVKLIETEPGMYSGKATFTMAGDWNVDVRVSKGGNVMSQRFPCLAR